MFLNIERLLRQMPWFVLPQFLSSDNQSRKWKLCLKFTNHVRGVNVITKSSRIEWWIFTLINSKTLSKSLVLLGFIFTQGAPFHKLILHNLSTFYLCTYSQIRSTYGPVIQRKNSCEIPYGSGWIKFRFTLVPSGIFVILLVFAQSFCLDLF